MHFLAFADNGKQLGTGHFFRSVSIARKIKNSFFFLNKNIPNKNELKKILIKYKLKYSFINNFNDIINYKKTNFCNKIIIDIPNIKSVEINKLKKKYKKIILLDYTKIKNTNYDLIINSYSWNRKKLKQSKQIFQGPKFFWTCNNIIKKKQISNNKKVLVCLGGSDIKKITFKILLYLEKYYQNLTINVVLGPGLNKVYKSKLKKFKYLKKIKFIEKNYNLKNVISNSDFGIISGGNILFECINVGLPSIVLATHFHQLFNIKYFYKKRMILYQKNNFNLRCLQLKKNINKIRNINFMKKLGIKMKFENYSINKIIDIIKNV